MESGSRTGQTGRTGRRSMSNAFQTAEGARRSRRTAGLTESARSAVWYAAWAVQEQRDDAAKAVAVAKVFVSDAAREVGNRSIQSHGGIGFTWEHQLHLYYKRAKADEFLFGDPTHTK